jgi:hypothetical protein
MTNISVDILFDVFGFLYLNLPKKGSIISEQMMNKSIVGNLTNK